MKGACARYRIVPRFSPKDVRWHYRNVGRLGGWVGGRLGAEGEGEGVTRTAGFDSARS